MVVYRRLFVFTRCVFTVNELVVYRRVAVLTCITCMFTVNELIAYKQIAVFITCMFTVSELIAYKQVAVFVTCMFTVSKSDCLQATTRIQL